MPIPGKANKVIVLLTRIFDNHKPCTSTIHKQTIGTLPSYRRTTEDCCTEIGGDFEYGFGQVASYRVSEFQSRSVWALARDSR